MTEQKLQGQIPRLSTKPADTSLVARSETSLDKVDVEELREWIARCDPFEPIDPEKDDRYFDFGKLSKEGVDLRGADHIKELFYGVTLSGRKSCQLFSGFSGTGKSTELRRLVRMLEAERYTVLFVDAGEYHDLSHPLAIEDLMVILAGAFSDATARLLGEKNSLDSYWKRLINFLNTEIEIQEGKIRAGVADLKIGVKHAKPFWVDIRETLSASPGKFRQECHDFIGDCTERILSADPDSRGVVFIFDTLERLKASMLNFEEMMQSVVRVLIESREYLHLPNCHAIYTIPPYVRQIRPELNNYYDSATVAMPAIKVVERGLNLVVFQPGVDALAALVSRRVPIGRVFGDRRDLLEKLIVYSGGHVRTLLVFIRKLLFNSPDHGFPARPEDIEQILQPFGEQARFSIRHGTVPLLSKILHAETLGNLTNEEYAALAEYMDTHIVLCYRNGDGWYEIHPLVRDYVRTLVAEEEARRDEIEGA